MEEALKGQKCTNCSGYAFEFRISFFAKLLTRYGIINTHYRYYSGAQYGRCACCLPLSRYSASRYCSALTYIQSCCAVGIVALLLLLCCALCSSSSAVRCATAALMCAVRGATAALLCALQQQLCCARCNSEQCAVQQQICCAMCNSSSAVRCAAGWAALLLCSELCCAVQQRCCCALCSSAAACSAACSAVRCAVAIYTVPWPLWPPPTPLPPPGPRITTSTSHTSTSQANNAHF